MTVFSLYTSFNFHHFYKFYPLEMSWTVFNCSLPIFIEILNLNLTFTLWRNSDSIDYIQGPRNKVKSGRADNWNNFFILKIEKRNKIIVFDFPKVGSGRKKVVGPRPYQPFPLRGPWHLYYTLSWLTTDGGIGGKVGISCSIHVMYSFKHSIVPLSGVFMQSYRSILHCWWS